MHAGSGGAVGAEDDAIEAAKFAGGVEREQGRAFVAVVDDFEPGRAAFADAGDLIIGQGGVAAVDMADDIGAGFEDHVGVDQARAGDRGAAGVDGGLDAVFAGPIDHLLGGFAVFDGAETYFAQKGDAGVGEVFEVLFDHAVFDHWGACVDFHAGGAEVFVPTLCGDGHCFEAHHVLGAAGHVDFARGDQGCYPAVQCAVDPVELLLARGIVADDGVDVAVDEARCEGRAVGVDRCGGVFAIKVGLGAPCGDFTVGGNQAVAVEDWCVDIARQDEADISDDQFCGCRIWHYSALL